MLERILQQMRLQCFCVGGKTLNVIQRYSLFVIQLVLQQCCKTSCTFFFARLSYLKPCSEVVFYDISKIGCLELEYILNVQPLKAVSSRAGPI